MKKHALKVFNMVFFVVMAFSTKVFAADVSVNTYAKKV